MLVARCRAQFAAGYPVWAGVVHAVVARAGVDVLDSHGYYLLCPVVVHVDQHVCLWCAVARSLPKEFPVWAGAALAEEVLEGEVALVAPLRLPM